MNYANTQFKKPSVPIKIPIKTANFSAYDNEIRLLYVFSDLLADHLRPSLEFFAAILDVKNLFVQFLHDVWLVLLGRDW